jgi:CHAT domain-containing protein
MFGAMSFNLTNIYSRAMITMEGNRLLDLLRSKVGPLEDIHLTIIPDGPLYELPVDAFPVARPARAYTPRVYEVFASVTYGLSLRTLQIQKSVEAARSELDSQDSVLKGVFMGNPDGLEHVRSEAQTFIRLTGEQSWWLHGKTSHEDCQTSLENFRDRHGTGNLLWISGHGVRQTEELGGSAFEEPALILVNGYLWLSEVLSGAYDFSSVRLIILNACWLGRIDPDRGHSKEIESYNAIMALRGCRRITSAMWPVYDEAALVFATAYVAALRRHVFSGSVPINPHGASSALRDALSALRRHDNGRFDHEYFWAPYTLYGLG